MKEQDNLPVKGAASTNAIFITLVAVMLACVLALFLLFREWTVLNFLNVFLIVLIAYVGAVKRNRRGWYILSVGTAVILFSYFSSYCINANGYFGYIYAIAFAVSMFALGYFISPRFQAGYGVDKPS